MRRNLADEGSNLYELQWHVKYTTHMFLDCGRGWSFFKGSAVAMPVVAAWL
jgi:hypothetical protein